MKKISRTPDTPGWKGLNKGGFCQTKGWGQGSVRRAFMAYKWEGYCDVQDAQLALHG